MKKILVFVISLFLLSALVLAQQGTPNPEAGSNDPENPGQNTDNGTPDNLGQGIGQDSNESQGTGNADSGIGQGDNPGIGQGDQVMDQTQTKLQDGTGDQLKEQAKEKLQTGLENAMSKVKNENAKMMLQQNIEKFQQKYEAKLQNMKELEIDEVDEETGAVKLKAKEDVKFLGFIKGKATRTYDIDAEGNIDEKKPWYRFLYKETSPEVEPVA